VCIAVCCSMCCSVSQCVLQCASVRVAVCAHSGIQIRIHDLTCAACPIRTHETTQRGYVRTYVRTYIHLNISIICSQGHRFTYYSYHIQRCDITKSYVKRHALSHTHTHAHTHTYTRMHTHTHIHSHAHTHIHTHT